LFGRKKIRVPEFRPIRIERRLSRFSGKIVIFIKVSLLRVQIKQTIFTPRWLKMIRDCENNMLFCKRSFAEKICRALKWIANKPRQVPF